MTHDALTEKLGRGAEREYLRILELAAKDGETLVNNILQVYLNADRFPLADEVEEYIRYEQRPDPVFEPQIQDVDLSGYDRLLVDGSEGEEAA